MSESRTSVPAAGTWGDIVGYSRAVRVGDAIHVSGTTAPGADVAEQARGAFETALGALAELGGSASDVVRTRMYLVDITQWEAAGRVHGEIFGEVKPANTMLEVSKLIDPSLLIEIEVEALLSEAR